MIQAAGTTSRPRKKAEQADAGRWPELMKISTAAEMLDMHPSTLRVLVAPLAADCGLAIYRVCGRRLNRDNVLDVFAKLQQTGRDVVVDNANRQVHIGDDAYAIPRKKTKQPVA